MLPHRTAEGDLQEGGIKNITGEPGSTAEELRLVQSRAPSQPSCCSGTPAQLWPQSWLAVPPIHCPPLLNNLFVAVTITGDQWSCIFRQELRCTVGLKIKVCTMLPWTPGAAELVCSGGGGLFLQPFPHSSSLRVQPCFLHCTGLLPTKPTFLHSDLGTTWLFVPPNSIQTAGILMSTSLKKALWLDNIVKLLWKLSGSMPFCLILAIYFSKFFPPPLTDTSSFRKFKSHGIEHLATSTVTINSGKNHQGMLSGEKSDEK